jgi:hypothetical protein
LTSINENYFHFDFSISVFLIFYDCKNKKKTKNEPLHFSENAVKCVLF